MFTIKHHGKAIENCTTLREAHRAFWTLTAHELKNGRVADLSLDTHSCAGVCQPEHCNPPLPEWVMQVLTDHGF